MSKVLILGNGFDLDLGLETKYSQFMESDLWPFKNEYGTNLGSYLNEKSRNKDLWFDLEILLRDYAKKEEDSYGVWRKEDEEKFLVLCKALCEYLTRQQEKDINKDSLAATVLRAVIENGKFSSIYNFNYTDLSIFAHKLGINGIFNCKNVHGCLEDNSIILGVEDAVDLKEGYNFLYKTFNQHYSSYPIQYDLMEADEIVFFGHSLGLMDYHYFKEFFKSRCNPRMVKKESKKITIFTYDNNSRREILSQLRNMNEKNTNLLFGLNEFVFICTSLPNEKENKDRLNLFLKSLVEDSVQADRLKFESMESGIY